MRKRIATSVLAVALLAVPAFAAESPAKAPSPAAKTEVHKGKAAGQKVAAAKKRTTYRRHHQHPAAPETAAKPATPQK